MSISNLHKWKLTRFVREHNGIALKEAAQLLGHDHRTVLRYARKARGVTVESGKKGRGHITRLWDTYDLPDRLVRVEVVATEGSSARSNTGRQYVDLDEI